MAVSTEVAPPTRFEDVKFLSYYVANFVSLNLFGTTLIGTNSLTGTNSPYIYSKENGDKFESLSVEVEPYFIGIDNFGFDEDDIQGSDDDNEIIETDDEIQTKDKRAVKKETDDEKTDTDSDGYFSDDGENDKEETETDSTEPEILIVPDQLLKNLQEAGKLPALYNVEHPVLEQPRSSSGFSLKMNQTSFSVQSSSREDAKILGCCLFRIDQKNLHIAEESAKMKKIHENKETNDILKALEEHKENAVERKTPKFVKAMGSCFGQNK